MAKLPTTTTWMGSARSAGRCTRNHAADTVTTEPTAPRWPNTGSRRAVPVSTSSKPTTATVAATVSDDSSSAYAANPKAPAAAAALVQTDSVGQRGARANATDANARAVAEYQGVSVPPPSAQAVATNAPTLIQAAHTTSLRARVRRTTTAVAATQTPDATSASRGASASANPISTPRGSTAIAATSASSLIGERRAHVVSDHRPRPSDPGCRDRGPRSAAIHRCGRDGEHGGDGRRPEHEPCREGVGSSPVLPLGEGEQAQRGGRRRPTVAQLRPQTQCGDGNHCGLRDGHQSPVDVGAHQAQQLDARRGGDPGDDERPDRPTLVACGQQRQEEGDRARGNGGHHGRSAERAAGAPTHEGERRRDGDTDESPLDGQRLGDVAALWHLVGEREAGEGNRQPHEWTHEVAQRRLGSADRDGGVDAGEAQRKHDQIGEQPTAGRGRGRPRRPWRRWPGRGAAHRRGTRGPDRRTALLGLVGTSLRRGRSGAGPARRSDATPLRRRRTRRRRSRRRRRRAGAHRGRPGRAPRGRPRPSSGRRPTTFGSRSGRRGWEVAVVRAVGPEWAVVPEASASASASAVE